MAMKKSTKTASAAHPDHAGGSVTTTDHDQIKAWAESRGGKPASVEGTGGGDDVGLIRLEFPSAVNANDAHLDEISWDDFFEKFDASGLAMVFQEETAGGERSNFNKLVKRETATATLARRAPARKTTAKKAAKKGPTVAKTTAKKTTAKKAAPAKAGAKKASAKKAPVTKKAAPAKTAAKKTSTAKKTTAKKVPPSRGFRGR